MTVPVRHPSVRVVLHKTIARMTVNGETAVSARYQGKRRMIDLTPFIGEGGGVRVTKGVREPAGAFSISLPDKMFRDSGQMDSVYSLIEPMDVIEIRMSHEPHKFDTLPIVMRGFVSRVRRNRAMAPDGRPSRQISISGHDYGKILQLIQIMYFQGYVLGQNLLTSMKMFANYSVNYGANGQNAPFGTLLREVLDKVVNVGATGEDGQWRPGFIASLASAQGDEAAADGPPIPSIHYIQPDIRDEGGACNAYGVQLFGGGTIYDLLYQYGDVGAFYEMFVEDREDGVYLVYRPNPYKDANGKWVVTPDTATNDSIVDLIDSEILAIDEERGDTNVANYFWVNMNAVQLVAPHFLKQAAAVGQDGLIDYYHQNNTPWLYGYRKMEVTSSQGTRLDGQSEQEIVKGSVPITALLLAKRKVLVDYNKDNVVFEHGTIRVAGNVNIKPGRYVRVRMGTALAECYAVSVDHDYQPYHGFFTTIQFERGTGFIERIKRAGSPYLAEMNAGGVN